jgi:transcriptional regulator with XRE-family HTH domain
VKRVYAPRRDGDPDAGRVIRARRRALGWSIERAARLAGCSTGMWSQLENAKRRPSIVMAAEIAEALGLTGTDLDTVLRAGLEGVGRDSPYKVWGVRRAARGRR